MRSKTSRRDFVRTGIRFSAFYLSAAPFIFGGCQPKKTISKEESAVISADPCNDFTGLSEDDIKTRGGLGYIRKSPVPNSQCSNCNLWLPPASGKPCGGCLLFKGPVDPAGYCSNWVPKT